MSGAIISVQSPEEREYARYLVDVEERKRWAGELEADVAILKAALARFNTEYHARVGSLFIDLDRVLLAIDEYKRRITRLTSSRETTPADVEQTLNEEFASRREEVHSQEHDNRQYHEAFAHERERPQLGKDAEAQLKALYHDLAKRFHPDLARTEDERLQRQTVMQRINDAFQERSLELLQRLAQESAVDDPMFEAKSLGEKLVWAIREVARLDGLIADLGAELVTLRASQVHDLWTRHEAGEAVIAVLEQDLQQEIAGHNSVLSDLITSYRVLLKNRTAHA